MTRSPFEQLFENDAVEHQRLRKLTEPLRSRLGIPRFAYGCVQKDGQFININNDPAMSAYLFSESRHDFLKFLCHPDRIETGIAFLANDPNYSQVIRTSPKEAPLYDPMCLLEKDSEGNAHCYWFASDKPNPHFSDLLTNNLGLLRSYSRYFYREGRELRQSFQPRAVYLPEVLGRQTFLKGSYHLPGKLPKDSAYGMLGDLGLGELTLKGARKLSPREKQVLGLLIRGFNNVEAASHLGLSSRTVEHYVDNLKNRLSVHSREELLSVGRLLDAASLLAT